MLVISVQRRLVRSLVWCWLRIYDSWDASCTCGCKLKLLLTAICTFIPAFLHFLLFPPIVGTFDVVLAANLLCRLPTPVKFLRSVPALLNPGGTLILVSPYSWLEEYTEKKEWIGACSSEADSFKVLSEFMAKECPSLKMIHREDIPFVIREHERKFQYGVSDCVVFVKSS